MKLLSWIAIVGLSVTPVVTAEQAQVTDKQEVVAENASAWTSFITARQLNELKAAETNLVIVDARDPASYAKGHIPGAINLPGEDLRTPNARPGEGDSQYFFRTADGSPDVQKYEQILSQAGIERKDHVVVYGSHAGKTDGSVAAMVLQWLGQEKVQFLDGIGVGQWTNAGFELSTEASKRHPTNYVAKPLANFVWNLEDVRKNLDNASVVFYDTRSIKEFTGEDPRDNARGGHIPGAVCIDYAAFLKSDKTTLGPDEVRSKLLASGVTPDKTVVLYCQTATRVSLPLLALNDLGYKKVAIYDASWHEYGNRQDTPIVAGPNPR